MDKDIKFRVCTTDAIIIKEDKVLMTKRSFGVYKGYWSFPGGRVDIGEDVRTACVREAKEETNLEVKIVHSLGYYDDPKRDNEKGAITFPFICEIIKGEPKHCDEATDIKWFSFDKLPEKIGWDHREILEEAENVLHEQDNKKAK